MGRLQSFTADEPRTQVVGSLNVCNADDTSH
jgi:hypothetical protein